MPSGIFFFDRNCFSHFTLLLPDVSLLLEVKHDIIELFLNTFYNNTNTYSYK